MLPGVVLLATACGTTDAVRPATDAPPAPAPVEDREAAPLPPAIESPAPAAEDGVSAPPWRTRLVAVGDIMLDGTARPYLERFGYDYAFARLGHLLRDADLCVANLEGPLTEHTVPLVHKTYLFRSPPRPVAAALAAAGIDAVSLANNHALDFGVQGLEDTRDALTGAGIASFGAGASMAAARTPVVIERDGVRIGLLGYSNTFPEEFWADAQRGGTAFGHEHHVRADVARLALRTDAVVVSFHWGREGTSELRPYQPLLARAAIDAGATVVIGHHPHVLQGIERYKHGVIFYSLGNFAFGSFSNRARVSAIAQVDLVEGQVAAVRLVPINVDNFEVYFQPRPLAHDRALVLFGELERMSRELDTELAWRDGVITLDAGTPARALAPGASDAARFAQ